MSKIVIALESTSAALTPAQKQKAKLAELKAELLALEKKIGKAETLKQRDTVKKQIATLSDKMKEAKLGSSTGPSSSAKSKTSTGYEYNKLLDDEIISKCTRWARANKFTVTHSPTFSSPGPLSLNNSVLDIKISSNGFSVYLEARPASNANQKGVLLADNPQIDAFARTAGKTLTEFVARAMAKAASKQRR